MMQIPILYQLGTNQRREPHPRDQHEFGMQNRAENTNNSTAYAKSMTHISQIK